MFLFQNNPNDIHSEGHNEVLKDKNIDTEKIDITKSTEKNLITTSTNIETNVIQNDVVKTKNLESQETTVKEKAETLSQYIGLLLKEIDSQVKQQAGFFSFATGLFASEIGESKDILIDLQDQLKQEGLTKNQFNHFLEDAKQKLKNVETDNDQIKLSIQQALSKLDSFQYDIPLQEKNILLVDNSHEDAKSLIKKQKDTKKQTPENQEELLIDPLEVNEEESAEKKEIKGFLNRIIESIDKSENINTKDKKLITSEFRKIEVLFWGNKNKENILENLNLHCNILIEKTSNLGLKNIFKNMKESLETMKPKTQLELEKREKEITEQIDQNEILRNISSPRLVRLLQHQNIDKNSLLKHLKPGIGTEINEQNRKIIKEQLHKIIKNELIKWMNTQLPYLQKKEEKRNEKEFKSALGETDGLGKKGVDMFKNLTNSITGASASVGQFPEGSVLNLVFTNQDAIIFAKKIASPSEEGGGENFAMSAAGKLEINGQKFTVDQMIDQSMDKILEGVDFEQLHRIRTEELHENNEHIEDVKFLLEKMETVPKVYIGTEWEKKYKAYVKTKAEFSVDFNEWVDQQNITFFEKAKFWIKEIWNTLEEFFGLKKLFGWKDEDEAKTKSEIQKNLNDILKKNEGNEPTKTGPEFQAMKNETIKAYKEAGITILIAGCQTPKDFETKVNSFPPSKKSEGEIQKMDEILSGAKNGTVLWKEALRHNLTWETLTQTIGKDEGRFDVKNGILLLRNDGGDMVKLEWNDQKIAEAVNANVTVIPDFKHLEFYNIKDRGLNIKIDNENIDFGDLLKTLQDIKPEELDNLTPGKKELCQLLNNNNTVRMFIQNLNSESVQKQLGNTTTNWGLLGGNTGELPFPLLKKISTHSAIRVQANKDPEVKVNPDCRTIGMGTGDLKVQIDGHQTWIDFDTFKQLAQILENPNSYEKVA